MGPVMLSCAIGSSHRRLLDTLPEHATQAPAPASTFASVWRLVRDQGPHLTVVAALLLCALACVWPLDVSFVNDEAALLGNALDANQRGELAEHGLMGSRGVRYGPAATWLYQGLLLVTHDV